MTNQLNPLNARQTHQPLGERQSFGLHPRIYHFRPDIKRPSCSKSAKVPIATIYLARDVNILKHDYQAKTDFAQAAWPMMSKVNLILLRTRTNPCAAEVAFTLKSSRLILNSPCARRSFPVTITLVGIVICRVTPWRVRSPLIFRSYWLAPATLPVTLVLLKTISGYWSGNRTISRNSLLMIFFCASVKTLLVSSIDAVLAVINSEEAVIPSAFNCASPVNSRTATRCSWPLNQSKPPGRPWAMNLLADASSVYRWAAR